MKLIAKTQNYSLFLVSNKSEYFLRLVSHRSQNSSDHFHVFVNIDGVRTKSSVCAENIESIAEEFLRAGPTLAFDMSWVKNEFSLLDDPATVLHQNTRQENSYTATGAKLNHHWPIFKKLADTGYGSVIRATMTLHQRCSSRCAFCSTINRSNADSISLEEAIHFVDTLYFGQAKYNQVFHPNYNQLYQEVTGSPIRLRSLILSGGGQPNLWPHFEDFVEYLSGLDIDLGLITNGFPSNVSDSAYSHFKWVRLSVTPPEASPHYENGRFESQYLPQSLFDEELAFGLSYVYGPWAEENIYGRLDNFAVEKNLKYVRLLTDCNLPRTRHLESHRHLAQKLLSEGLIDSSGRPTSKIFHQLKYHMSSGEAEQLWPSGTCFLQSYNVFWDTTGHDVAGHSYCYPCDSVTVLAGENEGFADSPERGFNPDKWGTVTNLHVSNLYDQPWQSFFDPRKNCHACLFSKNNSAVRDLVHSYSEDPHHSVEVDYSLEHVNFP